MATLPDVSALNVGLTSRNQVTAGGRVVLSPAVHAECVTDGTSASWTICDLFGLPLASVTPFRVLVLDAVSDTLATGAADVTASVGSVAAMGESVLAALCSVDGALSLSWVGPGRLALWLTTDTLVVSGVLGEA